MPNPHYTPPTERQVEIWHEKHLRGELFTGGEIGTLLRYLAYLRIKKVSGTYSSAQSLRTGQH